MSFYNDEYKHLLLAERTMAKALERDDLLPRDAAMVASALTRIVDQKRVMRGQPAPKPSDTADRRKRKACVPAPSITYADPSPAPNSPPHEPPR